MERDGKGVGMLLRAPLWRKLFSGQIERKKIRAFLLLLVRRLIDRKRAVARSVRGTGGMVQPDLALERELDELRNRDVALTIAFSAAEKQGEELDLTGVPDQLDRWPNVRLVDLPGVDHALASTSAQSAARALISRETEAAALLAGAQSS